MTHLLRDTNCFNAETTFLPTPLVFHLEFQGSYRRNVDICQRDHGEAEREPKRASWRSPLKLKVFLYIFIQKVAKT